VWGTWGGAWHLARANICPLPHLLHVIHAQGSFNVFDGAEICVKLVAKAY
jgi:hypothetical protein